MQNAIIGNDNSLTGGLLGAAVLFVINDLLVRWSYRRPRVRRMIEGRAEALIQDGRVLKHALERNFITREELVAAARKQGIDHLHAVESARLEVSGALSFTLREPSATEAFRNEVLARLASIERRLGAVATVLLLVAVARGGLQAQARPSTDVWVVPMHQTGGEVHFGDPRNVSKRKGYDNQPGFTPDGHAVLYTVIGDDGQADIWRYSLAGGRPRRITVTAESEYSATATPDGAWLVTLDPLAASAEPQSATHFMPLDLLMNVFNVRRRLASSSTMATRILMGWMGRVDWAGCHRLPGAGLTSGPGFRFRERIAIVYFRRWKPAVPVDCGVRGRCR